MQANQLGGGRSPYGRTKDYPRAKYILRVNITENVKLQTVIDLQVLIDVKQIINFICAQLGMVRVDELELQDYKRRKLSDIP